MLTSTRTLEPSFFQAFRCIGSACEDTCCNGFQIAVDRATYQRYEDSSDPGLRASLQKLVRIQPPAASENHYASIEFSGSQCPFLDDKLCSIQARYGEEYLPGVCATYPRALRRTGDVLERSLDLSCPEAARLALLSPEPLSFVENETASPGTIIADNPDANHPYFQPVRSLAVLLLQNRTYPLWQRVVLLGHFCDALHDLATSGRESETISLIEGYLDGLRLGLFDGLFLKYRPQPELQLAIGLELIAVRSNAGSTTDRFRTLYEQFLQGLTSASQSMPEAYKNAYSQHYWPLLAEREYLLEHYLVNAVFRKFSPVSLRRHYLLIATHYAVTKTILIGLAGFHQANFAVDHVVNAIQICTKTFAHSVLFSDKAIALLKAQGMETAAATGALIQN